MGTFEDICIGTAVKGLLLWWTQNMSHLLAVRTPTRYFSKRVSHKILSGP